VFLTKLDVLTTIKTLTGYQQAAAWAGLGLAGLVIVLFVGLATFAAYMYTLARLRVPATGEPSKFLTFNKPSLEKKWAGIPIPVETMYEHYFAGDLDFKGDVLETMLNHRRQFVAFRFNLSHIKFFVTQWVPELLAHTKAQDESQVREHYDRGNDFYNAFLGSTMVYTSGIRLSENDSLVDLQYQKIDLVCQKIQLKKGERLLDIGCGWGSLVLQATKNYGAQATGVTLSSEQVKWAEEVASLRGIPCPRFLRMDYRDIPQEKFNKITCLEMAEHVGVKNFSTFLLQVRSMLEDDGIFYLQIAGLRRLWQFEDLVWGLFMAKYVFPGADASMPLGWVVNKLEEAGWEILQVDTVGCHYSATLECWYHNWIANKDAVISKYGVRWFRKWEVFLAWSSIIANQGSATCYQITTHKNLNTFNRRRFWDRPLLK